MSRIAGIWKHGSYKPRITEYIVVTLFENPVNSGLLELGQGPRGNISLVGECVVLVYGADVDILVFETVSEQAEESKVMGGVIGVVGGGRGKGIPQFCFFLLHGFG